jgi:DNA-directed RNA polymerase subunit RPC12/RpoP
MKYMCAVCKEECENDDLEWNEEDWMKEALELFPDYDLTREENRSMVCEDCHSKVILEWMAQGFPENAH